jgi:hypothetical protein
MISENMTSDELWAQCSTVEDIVVKGKDPRDQQQIDDLWIASLHCGLTDPQDIRAKIKSGMSALYSKILGDVVLVLFTYDTLFERSAKEELYAQGAMTLSTIPSIWVSIMDRTIE